mmetsp:Transcript_4560/g.16612  ORF Transcript_4560/g.16612 Transcript_4560/m.16612 type:complete len:108 (-) Transcript_4560:747-1070(-)
MAAGIHSQVLIQSEGIRLPFFHKECASSYHGAVCTTDASVLVHVAEFTFYRIYWHITKDWSIGFHAHFEFLVRVLLCVMRIFFDVIVNGFEHFWSLVINPFLLKKVA